ncbi:MAG TPA: putative toxin-antitoxin system toxin component, PIN family [Terracidiphilus sp.]|nr:putative toxin-antitoxin system toxin component, PIN family [Terracidiphilus sp.]
MSGIGRVVFDTSTLVSAALRSGSVPHQALLKAFASCDVCASGETLAELELVLDRVKFDRYLDRESRRAFVALIRRNVYLFVIKAAELAAVQPPCRDPRDDQFLALALAAEADAIVSNDEDMLVLHPWRGIPILTPADFLSMDPTDQP